MNIKKGWILVGEGHDITDKLQYLVNGKGASHGCVITFPDGSKQNMTMVLSAEYNGVVHALWNKWASDTKYNYWLYEIIGATEEQINHALDYCEDHFLNAKYAYLSWIWFGYKSLMEFLHINVHKQHNWYFKDCFCTEHVYYFMLEAGVPQELLKDWYPDTFQPMNLKNLLINNPSLFKLISQRVDGATKLV